MNQTVDKGGKDKAFNNCGKAKRGTGLSLCPVMYQERKNYMFGRFGLPEGMIHNKNDCGGYDHGDSFSRIISYGKEIYPPYDPEDVRVYRAAIEGIVSDAVENPDYENIQAIETEIASYDSKNKALEEEINRLLQQMAENASERIVYAHALSLLNSTPAENSACKWVECEKSYEVFMTERCSNDVYSASLTMQKSYRTGKPYRVDVGVSLLSPFDNDSSILSTTREFPSREEAEGYYQRRKDYITKKYFKEQSPVVPFDHEYAFKSCGLYSPC